MRIAHPRWIAVAVVAIVAADWISKFFVQNHLRIGSFHPVVDGWVWFAHRRNTGVAFSFLADVAHGWRLPFLVGAALLGIGVAGVILAQTRDALARVAAGLVIAGAVGNLGDRVMNGAVTDFILVRFFPFVFNVADIAISVGAVLLLARLFLEERGRGSDPTPASS